MSDQTVDRDKTPRIHRLKLKGLNSSAPLTSPDQNQAETLQLMVNPAPSATQKLAYSTIYPIRYVN